MRLAFAERADDEVAGGGGDGRKMQEAREKGARERGEKRRSETARRRLARVHQCGRWLSAAK